MIIYKTTNLINGLFYIGKDCKNNPEYLGSGLLLKRAIKKYGIKNFTKEILEICVDEQHLNEREKYWIAKLNATDNKIGYNLAEGGTGGFTLKGLDPIAYAEYRKKCKARIALMPVEERKKKYGNRLGTKSSEQTKQKQSKISKERGINVGEKNGNYGKIPWNKGGSDRYTAEVRKKMSDSHKGKTPWNKGIPASEEQKKKQSAKLKGKKLSDWHKLRLKQGRVNSEKVKAANERKKGIPSKLKGIKWTAERKHRHSEIMMLKMNNPDIKKKISAGKIGKSSPRKGIKLSAAIKKKISKSVKRANKLRKART